MKLYSEKKEKMLLTLNMRQHFILLFTLNAIEVATSS